MSLHASKLGEYLAAVSKARERLSADPSTKNKNRLRKARNRLAAMASRERHILFVEQMHKRTGELEQKVREMRLELAALRRICDDMLCKSCGERATCCAECTASRLGIEQASVIPTSAVVDVGTWNETIPDDLRVIYEQNPPDTYPAFETHDSLMASAQACMRELAVARE